MDLIVFQSGGLIDALGPKLGGRKTTHPETHDVTLSCPGFNRKNDYDRQTPCDQDFLRKFSRDTEVDQLHAWFSREVPRSLRSLRLFDAEGLFLGDGSYLFVPDNEHYEGSDLLWFDEHNHPVDPNQVDLRDKRYQQHRCYKLVSLIHINRRLDFFFVVAARVVSGRRHECPILYELVDQVVRAVGREVLKVLILDRGFIDGAQMGRLWQDYRIETILPVRSNMDLHGDAVGLTRLRNFLWEPYVPAEPPAPAPLALPKPLQVEKREAKRQQTLARRKAETQGGPAAAPAARPQTLLGRGHGLLSWSQCPVPLTAVVNREWWPCTTARAVLPAEAGRIRPPPAGRGRAGSRQTARRTPTDRARAILLVGKRPAALAAAHRTRIHPGQIRRRSPWWSGGPILAEVPARRMAQPTECEQHHPILGPHRGENGT
jgi:hypothetical protein